MGRRGVGSVPRDADTAFVKGWYRMISQVEYCPLSPDLVSRFRSFIHEENLPYPNLASIDLEASLHEIRIPDSLLGHLLVALALLDAVHRASCLKLF